MDVSYEIVKIITEMLENAETVTEDDTTVTLKIERKYFVDLLPYALMGALGV